ncbi:MAG: hypothetical protein ACU833_00800 [Gammaproteobacteria bacterium]
MKINSEPARHSSISPALAGLIFLCLTIPSCLHVKTPDQVALAFWEALLTDDIQTARKYATEESGTLIELPDPAWKNASPQIGEIRIKDREASVETVILPKSGPGNDSYTLMTYLVQENDAWKVDYKRTRYSLPGSIFEGLFKSLQNIGETFSREIEKEMPQIEKELESFGEQLREQLDQFGKELEKILEPPQKQARPDSI